MTALTYSAACHGDGHTPCDWTTDDPGSDLAARKHADGELHATSTHARVERKPA